MFNLGLNPTYIFEHGQKGCGIAYQFLFRLQNIEKNVFFSDQTLWQFWWYSTKWSLSYSIITFANLWKPIHDVIIILVSSDSLNLENGKRKAKYLQTFE